ncbi:unnamed protein product, partial [Closterium sp. NIES-54]
SSLFTLTTASAQVAESGQVAASSQVPASGQLAASCLCRVLSHQTLLWHHRLGHPSLPRLCGMHSRLLVSGLPRSLPSLPCSPAPPSLPCVEGRQRAAPHSSEFPPTTALLQTLHMDVWGPAPVGGTDQERYFLLVVDDYTRYTTVFPLRRKADISSVLIPWIRATRRQLRERFSRDFPVLRLHYDRGGEFSSDLLAERRIGLIMELNLWPRVSEPESSPTLRWTGKVGNASVFRVWGALSFVRDANASKLSSRTLRCEPLEISFDSSGPAEGGDPAADDTAVTRHSPRLETPPGFLTRPSSPPPQSAAVDSRAKTAGAELGGAEIEGEGSGGVATGGAATRGAGSGGADYRATAA